jgi:hypothetical protein
MLTGDVAEAVNSEKWLKTVASEAEKVLSLLALLEQKYKY